ncbi:MAG: AraC family transcriptional regulator [Clostridia bacterium]|nr:AraC family transcriptional regulator [Clostridia bacterium]
MDTTASLNAAMRYIEKHLLNAIDFNEVARIACCSEYQFRRMFSYLAGMPLNEYIRKRRLSFAAELLYSGGEKIIHISHQCGYESPDAFAKAFQIQYGITPSAFRKDSITLKAFPPLFFHLTVKGGIEMDYRIVEKGAFYIMGKSGRIPLIYHGANPHFAAVWQEIQNDGILVLTEYSEVEPKGILEIYDEYDPSNPVEGDEFTLYVGIAMEKPMPDYFKGRFDVLSLNASTWLVFTAIDNTKRNDVWGRKQLHARISEWLPTSGYQVNGPTMIWFASYDAHRPDLKSEIWVSVRKRD